MRPASTSRSATSPEGRERWPSTESISKILRATGATLEDFLRLVEPAGSLRRSMIPLIGMDAGRVGKDLHDDGLPTSGPGWDEIEFPDFGQEKVFALEVTGDSMAPLYRDGDVLIVSPTASIRKGDRDRRAHHERTRSWPRNSSAARPRPWS